MSRTPRIVHMDEVRITPLIGGGLNHQLYIRSGAWEFTGNFDNNFQHFVEVMQQAMKYFALCYGTITIDPDGTVHRVEKGH
jgi:hypothetical protein